MQEYKRHCLTAAREQCFSNSGFVRIPTFVADHERHRDEGVGGAAGCEKDGRSYLDAVNSQPILRVAGPIGATPVLAMLHALAAERPTREVLWIHGARDHQHHPFAVEARRLMLPLARGRSYVCYSRPGTSDKLGEDFDATGRLSRSVFDQIGVPRDADVYLCGPGPFMAEMKEALTTIGVAPGRIHVEVFSGRESMTPGILGASTRAPHLLADDANTGPLVSFARSGIAVHWKTPTFQSILEACGGVRRPGPLVVPNRCLSQL